MGINDALLRLTVNPQLRGSLELFERGDPRADDATFIEGLICDRTMLLRLMISLCASREGHLF